MSLKKLQNFKSFNIETPDRKPMNEIQETDNYYMASDAHRIAILFKDKNNKTLTHKFNNTFNTLINASKVYFNNSDMNTCSLNRKETIDIINNLFKELKTSYKDRYDKVLHIYNTLVIFKFNRSNSKCYLQLKTYTEPNEKIIDEAQTQILNTEAKISFDNYRYGFYGNVVNEYSLAVNTKYILEQLDFMEDKYNDSIELRFTTSVSPIVTENDTKFVMTLPIRVSDIYK